METGRQYDEKCKVQAIKLAREIETKQVADELEIPKGTLGGWVKKRRMEKWTSELETEVRKKH